MQKNIIVCDYIHKILYLYKVFVNDKKTVAANYREASV